MEITIINTRIHAKFQLLSTNIHVTFCNHRVVSCTFANHINTVDKIGCRLRPTARRMGFLETFSKHE